MRIKKIIYDSLLIDGAKICTNDLAENKLKFKFINDIRDVNKTGK